MLIVIDIIRNGTMKIIETTTMEEHMKYIGDFKENEYINEHYLCKKKITMQSKSGKNYLSLQLADKTGDISAKIWEINRDIQSFEENDFIKIEGTVLLYQSDLQLKVTRIRKSMVGEYTTADYIPSSENNVDEMYAKLLKYIESFTNTHIKALCEEIFKDKEIETAYKTHSAAKTVHHNYMGGLLEHSLSVADICEFMSDKYKHVNRDFLVATALLHDVGKIYELSDFPENDYTNIGQLLGHIYIGAEIVEKYASKIEKFPEDLAILIKHSILAHHGEYEYGSPKKPKTIEALILHQADNMDSQAKIFEKALSEHNTKSPWVGYSKIFDRNIRKSEF